MRWHDLEDLDESIVSAVLWGLYAEYQEQDNDIRIDIDQVDMLPKLAMLDLASGGEPLVRLSVNIEKLEQLQSMLRAKQQLAETKGEYNREAHIQEQFFDFELTEEKALQVVLSEANAQCLMRGEQCIAPSELFLGISGYVFEENKPAKSMVRVSIDRRMIAMAIVNSERQKKIETLQTQKFVESNLAQSNLDGDDIRSLRQ